MRRTEETPPFIVRLGTYADADEVVALLASEGASVGRSHNPEVARALVKDTAPPRHRTVVSVAEIEGRIVAAIIVIAGNVPHYWATLALRHPRAGLAVIGRWVRVAPHRLTTRWSRRALTPAEDLPPSEAPASTVAVPLDPRLGVPAPGRDDPRSRLGETGAAIAFCIQTVVDPSCRGRHISRAITVAALIELRRLGLERYDCTFQLDNIAAIKLHLSLPLTIHRYPTGYFGTVDLTAPGIVDELGRTG